MMRARLLPVTLGMLAIAACSGGDSSSTSFSTSLGEASTGTTSDDGPDPTTTDPSAGSGTGDPSSTSTGPVTADDTTTTAGDGSSTSDGCVPGTEGCACDAGGCDDELLCFDEICLAPECDGDVFETNEDEDDATVLGRINDNDNNGGVVSGSLHYPGDVDWYRYQGDDDITGNVDPGRELVSSAGVRMCKFLECDNGLPETEFECPAGTDYALSPMARPGCCASGDIQLPDLNCTGVTEDNAMVYIRIDMPEEDCVTYSVSYHY